MDKDLIFLNSRRLLRVWKQPRRGEDLKKQILHDLSIGMNIWICHCSLCWLLVLGFSLVSFHSLWSLNKCEASSATRFPPSTSIATARFPTNSTHSASTIYVLAFSTTSIWFPVASPTFYTPTSAPYKERPPAPSSKECNLEAWGSQSPGFT